jgi:hypothetical protein
VGAGEGGAEGRFSGGGGGGGSSLIERIGFSVQEGSLSAFEFIQQRISSIISLNCIFHYSTENVYKAVMFRWSTEFNFMNQIVVLT